MIAACYDLSLQCDGEGCRAADGLPRRASITGEHGSTCRTQARRAGWRLWTVRGVCLCPSCAERGAEIVIS